MTSLVAYDNSSESENEESHKLDSVSRINTIPYSPNGVVNEVRHSVANDLLASLPRPKVQPFTVREKLNESLETRKQTANKRQKVKERIKIVVSSLKEFESDNDESSTEKKSNKNINGLFALLPPPKGTMQSNTSFLPNVLQKKINVSAIALSPKIVPQYKTKRRKALANPDISSDVENEIEIPETFDDETWQKVCGKRNKGTFKPTIQEIVPVCYQDLSNVITLAPDVQKPYTGLNNKSFKKLVSNSKKLKENVKLIDIHEDEIRTDRNEWLKSLTDPTSEPKCIVQNTVNNVSKIKNHITSLAQKALANDEELQRKWSENRHNRRQTQAKYGF